MSLLHSLKDYFAIPSNTQLAPSGVCPNCWGSQAYGDLVRDIEKDFQLEVNRGTGNYDFLKTFVKTHVEGIRLVNKIEGAVCEQCRHVG